MGCRRCAWLRAAHWSDLIFFWNPGKEPTETDGERVRAEALWLHADAGHPAD